VSTDTAADGPPPARRVVTQLVDARAFVARRERALAGELTSVKSRPGARHYRRGVVGISPGAVQSGLVTEPDDGRLADAVDRILRADGRSPAVDVAACLSLEERALHRVLGDASVRRGAAPPDATGPMCHLAVHEYGRAYVSLARPEGRDLHAKGWTRVSPAELVPRPISS